ncbi:MAG: ATP-binding protein [Thermoproteota archaeon]
MLFDIRPKSSRSDLFDRENELRELDRAVDHGRPLTLVLGIRRIGKTSLVKAFLGERRGLYLDARGVSRRSELYERIGDGLYSSLSRVRRLLEGIRGVSFSAAGVEVRWRGSDSVSFMGLLQEINRRGERFILVVDEVQSLKPPLSAELRNLIAYSYDNLENISLVISGSEIGLLRSFLGVDNPSSPLYGRYVHEVHVERFSGGLSREFLVEGFKEEGLKPPSKTIEEAVELFDGIVGWLVFFGRSYADGTRNISRIFDMAVNLALEELKKLNEREKIILKAIAEGADSWSRVRSLVSEKRGIVLPKSTLTRIIDKLEMMSIVKDYEFLDPIYREACRKLRP